nr:cellulose synthase catalytic subunit [udp-forming] [Quercus suber]
MVPLQVDSWYMSTHHHNLSDLPDQEPRAVTRLCRLGVAADSVHRMWMCPYVPVLLANIPCPANHGQLVERSLFCLVFLGSKNDSPPSVELQGDEAPTIDVFITYCGEGIDIVEDTMIAACSQTYPAKALRVIVLDDSCSEKLKALIEEMNRSRFPNLFYTTRGNRPKVHSKAANMNHGLEYTTLSGRVGDLVSVLDCDNIPEVNWLRRLVPHIVQDEKVGAVGVSARSYNIPANDPLGTGLEPRLMYGVLFPILGGAGSPVLVGTGFIARRAAVDSVGGFPTQSITDDGLLTTMLQSYGWKLVWAQENVQWNLVTETLAGQIKQRARWFVGMVNTLVYAATTREPYWSARRRTKIVVLHVLQFFAAFIVPFSMIFLPLALLTGVPLTSPDSPAQGTTLLALSVVDVLAQIAHGIAVAALARRPISILYSAEKQWVVPYFLPAVIKHYLPKKQAPKADFQAASADRTEATKTQASTLAKLTAAQIGTMINVASLGLTVLSLSTNVLAAFAGPRADAGLAHFLLRAGWPSLLLISVGHLTNSWVLVRALEAAFPEIPRESIIQRDPKTGLAHPTAEAQRIYEREGKRISWTVVAVAVYALGVAGSLFVL